MIKKPNHQFFPYKKNSLFSMILFGEVSLYIYQYTYKKDYQYSEYFGNDYKHVVQIYEKGSPWCYTPSSPVNILKFRKDLPRWKKLLGRETDDSMHTGTASISDHRYASVSR